MAKRYNPINPKGMAGMSPTGLELGPDYGPTLRQGGPR
jgi:hypothetical protein